MLREADRWVRIADLPAIAGGPAMRITAPNGTSRPVERVVATWYRIGDVTTADPARVKLETARARLLGRPAAATALHLSAEGPNARAAIERFLRTLGPVDRAVDRILSPS